MFKADLIENESYYKMKSKQFLLIIFSSVFMGLGINFYQLPLWSTTLIAGLYILCIIFLYRYQKRIHALHNQRSLELDEYQVHIKSQNGSFVQTIHLNEVDRIFIKENYSMPQETMQDVGAEIAGKINRNYIVIQQGQKEVSLDFEIESYYRLNQLKKILGRWQEMNYPIEILSTV